MNKDGRQMSDWLKDVEKDQNLEKIADIEPPVLTALRRWFVSRVIGMGIRTGFYNRQTGKIVLGDLELLARYGTPTLAASAVSQATYTITGAANGTIVVYLTHSNATRVPKFKLTLSDGTTAVDIREGSSNDYQTVQNILVARGAKGNIAGAPLTPGNTPIYEYIFVPPNWTLVSTEENFVAADVMRAEAGIIEV